jgi:predicted ATPase
MQDVFITKIHIGKLRHLAHIDIVLSDTERKHLILTGKNGSGKTSLLEAMRDTVLLAQRRSRAHRNAPLNRAETDALLLSGYNDSALQARAGNLSIDYSVNDVDLYDVTFAHISAVRDKPILPKAIEPIDIQAKTVITREAGKDFLKYILNLYVQYLSAKDSGNLAEVEKCKKWLDGFKDALREIYDCPELELNPDMKKLAFLLAVPGREPFGLHEMSAGYEALLDIYMELLIRLAGADGIVDFEQSAIVLIDELETHLHVELQKRALPFLTRMFPHVQFIIATHSPFVITSVDNAVAFDLERAAELRSRGEDPDGARLDGSDAPLTTYSYEDIVEGYYDVGGYSEIFRREFGRYKELCGRGDLSADEEKEKARLKYKMDCVPPSAKLLRHEIDALENGGGGK